jgi:perosamine synthetase
MTQERNSTFRELVDFTRSIYGERFIPLHRPVFEGNERQYLVDCIDSNFVSSVGAKVTEFEQLVAHFTGAKFAVATVNGTSALHIALQLVGVQRSEEVITQALSFIATCNALSYAGAVPVFVDVDRDSLGMSADALSRFLAANAERRDGGTFNKTSGRRIRACVPMHTFGHPCRIEQIAAVCAEYGIELVEDAAESLGSFVGQRHTGTFGKLGTLSFNGNKVITTGGGGMIITDDEPVAKRAKHLTTTAKIPHPFEFVHDEVGYNYRLPNLNAALGCAQMERLPQMLAVKANVARQYADFCERVGLKFVSAPHGSKSNYWLNAIVMNSVGERDALLDYTNARDVMTRPIWRLMNRLPMYSGCQHDGLAVSSWLEQRVVNLPSSVPDDAFGKLRA